MKLYNMKIVSLNLLLFKVVLCSNSYHHSFHGLLQVVPSIWEPVSPANMKGQETIMFKEVDKGMVFPLC